MNGFLSVTASLSVEYFVVLSSDHDTTNCGAWLVVTTGHDDSRAIDAL